MEPDHLFGRFAYMKNDIPEAGCAHQAGTCRFGTDPATSVLNVDRHDYHAFQPPLYQVATGLLETTAVGHSLRDLLERQDNTTVHKATVIGVDLDAREVRFNELAPMTYDFRGARRRGDRPPARR
jgi:NADH dehydrogenase FAD-containing subunit